MGLQIIQDIMFFAFVMSILTTLAVVGVFLFCFIAEVFVGPYK